MAEVSQKFREGFHILGKKTFSKAERRFAVAAGTYTQRTQKDRLTERQTDRQKEKRQEYKQKDRQRDLQTDIRYR